MRKLKRNTTFGNGESAQLLQALVRWKAQCFQRIEEEGKTERLNDAINAVGTMLLEYVEAAYEEERKDFKVDMTTEKRTEMKYPVYVKAKDSCEAYETAKRLVLADHAKSCPDGSRLVVTGMSATEVAHDDGDNE